MGYHIRTGLVEDHAAILDTILSAVNRGESLRYDCRKPEAMNKLKYSFNRILRASTILRNECNGNFFGLRGRVRVREDWKNMAIIIEPVIPTGTLGALVPAQFSEHDAIEKLQQFDGRMDLVKFMPSPSFALDEWRVELKRIGFDLMLDPDEPDAWIGGEREGGELEYAVARVIKKTPTGFDMLSAFDD